MFLKKIRGQRKALVQSQYVRKGVEGNTHGFPRSVILCRLPANATSLTDDVAQRLSDSQRAYLERELLGPNRQREAEALAEAELRAKDPTWRLAEALKLVVDAQALSVDRPLAASVVSSLKAALEAVRVRGSGVAAPQAKPVDPLKTALAAVRAASDAVSGDFYNSPPESGIRDTPVHRLWMELNEALSGDAESSLLRRLQRKGWVAARSRK